MSRWRRRIDRDDAADGNVYFRRTYADHGRTPAIEVGVEKRGAVDELRVTSPDCDLDVPLEVALDGAVTLADDDELRDCGDRPTLEVVGERDGESGRVASHRVDLGDTLPVKATDGNAGTRLRTTGSVSGHRDGRLELDIDPIDGADEVWVESPDCPLEISLDADGPLAATLHPDDELAECPAESALWVVAADGEGEALVFEYDPSQFG
ncbi:hypothetical protein [Halovivax gelatinilyticus]|uniref:hypothetical protein n=1 Tax=Halovivax gelatinilyticus TaxID=2961597 RepID=UPI0020CA335E|nr:hypothetical protein [Halovivax gelatinilyticus]